MKVHLCQCGECDELGQSKVAMVKWRAYLQHDRVQKAANKLLMGIAQEIREHFNLSYGRVHEHPRVNPLTGRAYSHDIPLYYYYGGGNGT